ncbi:MAG: FAD-dependent thymidylate synthase [Candidatus Diapherotrites archaeon]|nr:FAD-dependent thymidylate synthase [Candidatus Diapherotrites archaeon]
MPATFESFTEQEKQVLKPYFTNLDQSIFVLQNLPEVVKGALFSRYSRSSKLLRRLLLEEFLNVKELGLTELLNHQANTQDPLVAAKKAEEFYDRVLVGFGDDSVAELAGCHIACEQVSMIATKALEDSRIGLCPLEKSTRYVYFDQKINGHYQYLLEKDLMNSEFADLYTETCDSLFDVYAKILEPMKKYFTDLYPKDAETSDRAYTSAVKAKTCDTIRGLLPASTLTNLGLYGNGRAFEYLLQKMYANPLSEMQSLASEMHSELRKYIPSFVKRANDSLGQTTIDFWQQSWAVQKKYAEKQFNQVPMESVPQVELIDFDSKAEEKVLTALLYSKTGLSLKQIRKHIQKLSVSEKQQIFQEYLNHRKNRRHKPGRGFETAQYTFDIHANFNAFRDLQRHRMLTQERQLLSCNLGHITPKELFDAGFAEEYQSVMSQAKESFDVIAKKMPAQAQYIVPMGYHVRWYISLNAREMYHLCELRSVQQGHPDYRYVAQQMFLEAQKVHPLLMNAMKFVDMKQYSFERIEAEKYTDKRMDEIKQKHGIEWKE